MSRRAFIIGIIAVLILGTAVLYYLLSGKAPMVTQILSGSPFGTAPTSTSSTGTPGGDSGNTSTNPSTGVGSDGKPLARFFKISDAPVAGAASINKNGSTYVRYIDRATGHIFDVNTATLEKQEIVNTTQPKIYDALWKQDGSGFISRTVKEGSDVVDNTSVTIIAPKSTSTANIYSEAATLLRGSVSDIIVNTDGSLTYSLADTGVVAGAAFNGDKPKTLFALAFNNWRLVPASASTALIYTKASSQALGYAYSLSLSNGSLTKLAGPLAGLTANLSPDAKRLAYEYTDATGNNIFSVLNMSSKTVTNLFPVTLPEKCAWSKKNTSIIICGAPSQGLGANEPDLWYQGSAHFSDVLWKTDASTGQSALLLDPKKDFNVDIDLEKPLLSPSEDYLFFTNKSDLSLWALKLVP